jgi:hypothetical protein
VTAADSESSSESEDIDVGELLLGLAERHARVGEDALALRCLNAAAQIRGAAPDAVAAAEPSQRSSTLSSSPTY